MLDWQHTTNGTVPYYSAAAGTGRAVLMLPTRSNPRAELHIYTGSERRIVKYPRVVSPTDALLGRCPDLLIWAEAQLTIHFDALALAAVCESPTP